MGHTVQGSKTAIFNLKLLRMKLNAHSLFKIEIYILVPSKSYILNRALEQNLQSNVVICYVFPDLFSTIYMVLQ